MVGMQCCIRLLVVLIVVEEEGIWPRLLAVGKHLAFSMTTQCSHSSTKLS
jgi:hypothetical protein